MMAKVITKRRLEEKMRETKKEIDKLKREIDNEKKESRELMTLGRKHSMRLTECEERYKELKDLDKECDTEDVGR